MIEVILYSSKLPFSSVKVGSAPGPSNVEVMSDKKSYLVPLKDRVVNCCATYPRRALKLCLPIALL